MKELLKSNKKQYLIQAIAIFLGFALWGLIQFAAFVGPGNLGPRVQYVGKYTSVCPLVIFCDAPTWESYFFATDLTEREAPSYFGGLQYISGDNPEGGGTNGTYRSDLLEFKDKAGKIWAFEYYDGENAPHVIKAYGLDKIKSEGRNIIEIKSEEFPAFKNALRVK